MYLHFSVLLAWSTSSSCQESQHRIQQFWRADCTHFTLDLLLAISLWAAMLFCLLLACCNPAKPCLPPHASSISFWDKVKPNHLNQLDNKVRHASGLWLSKDELWKPNPFRKLSAQYFFFNSSKQESSFFVMKAGSCRPAAHLQLQHLLEYVCFNSVLLCTIN